MPPYMPKCIWCSEIFSPWDYLFVSLIALLGLAVLLELTLVIRGSLRSTDLRDSHDRAGGRDERWYPLS